MKEIRRENGEDIKSFIKRACEEKFSVDEDVDLIFGDGITLKTSGYNDIDDIELLAERLEADYNTIKSYRIERGLDSEESFDEVIHEEDVDDMSEGFEENLSKEDEEQNLISTTSLESLQLLTDAAVRDGDFPKIDLNERKKLSQLLEETKKSYPILLEEKRKQTEVTMKRIEDSAHERGRQIKEEIDLINAQKQEYSRIVEEYKVEVENLEKGYVELKEKLDNGEFSQDVIDMINKSKVLEDKNIKSSELLEYIPVEELRHIYKLKWNVEAYQEYLDFFYTKNYPDRVKLSVDILKNASVESKLEFEESMITLLPGAKRGEDGKIDYDVERDDPELIEMRDYIATLEVFVKNSEKHPVVVEDKILTMMYEKKSSEEIKPLLDELMSNVKNNVIVGNFASDEERLENVNSEISVITAKLEKIKEESIDVEPLNEDLINIDNNRIERLKVTSEELAKEIDECDLVIAKKDNNMRIDNLSERINRYNLFRLRNIEEKNLYIANNGKKENDPEIASFNQNIEFCNKTINSLKELRKELVEENKKTKKFMTVKQAEAKKAKLSSKKEVVDKSIDELELDRQKKIDNGEYVDRILLNKRKKEIRDLEEELEFLENLKIAITKHNVETIQDSILNYDNPNYSNDKDLDNDEETFEENIQEEDLEEIIGEKPAKKSLIEKIKSFSFKKFAKKAILTIATAAAVVVGAMGINTINKIENEKEQLKQVGTQLENLTDDTKVPEKMETVAKVEKEKIELETEKTIEQQSIVDTSRIAGDIYKAAAGDFIPEERVSKDRFDDKLIEDIIEMEANGETVYVVVGENGVSIGATDRINENYETTKLR